MMGHCRHGSTGAATEGAQVVYNGAGSATIPPFSSPGPAGLMEVVTTMPKRDLPLVPTLVTMLHPQVMALLGKLSNPMTGKIERDLHAAKAWIDLLGELEEKTEGRLDDDERRLLQHTLSELRLNYLDEMKKPDPSAADAGASEGAPGESPAAATAQENDD